MARRHRRRDAPGRPAWGVVVTTLVASLMAAACGPGESPDAGPGDRGTASDPGTSTVPQGAPGVLDASITTVGSSLRIAWTVTNASGATWSCSTTDARTRPRAANATVRS